MGRLVLLRSLPMEIRVFFGSIATPSIRTSGAVRVNLCKSVAFFGGLGGFKMTFRRIYENKVPNARENGPLNIAVSGDAPQPV